MANSGKLSFSLSSKPSGAAAASRPKPFSTAGDGDEAAEETAKPQFVTVFDSSQAPTPASATKLVIPAIPNSDLRSAKKKKNLLPDPLDAAASGETKFVLDTSTGDAPASHISYGLNLRSSNSSGAAARDPKPPSEEESRDVGGRPPTAEDSILRPFKGDMRKLPEHRGFDEYKDVSVEDFGLAIVRGYGWSEGQGLGKKRKEETKVVQYALPRGTEGLGYNPSSSDPKKRRGSEWVVQEKKEKDKKEEVRNGRDMVVKSGTAVQEKFLRRTNELRISEKDGRREESSSDRRREERRSRDEGARRVDNSRQRSGNSGAERREPVRWLTSHIRVRIISKEFMRGKLYLKKGQVVDVVSPTKCDVAMDGSGELLQGVDQEILETALPKRGGSVLVLYGKHKGVYGSLVEKNSEDETGLVRDADSHALINVRLEQIAEYTGDPSYLGY